MARVLDLMTENPSSVGVDATLAEALRSMREEGVRHLPVLRDGKLAGVVSERDLVLLGTMPDVDANAVTVERALGTEPFTVGPDTPLVDVIRALSEKRTDNAIVVEGDRVVGIVTTTDCLRCLFDHLSTAESGASLRPSAVRQRILEEHRLIRERFDEVERLAKAVAEGSLDPGRLASVVKPLLERVEAHLALEDRILAPALRETPGFGEIRVQKLLEHHDAQRAAIERAMKALMHPKLDEGEVTESVLTLIAEVRADIARENKELLGPNLLKDDPINVEFGG
jgi:acetoin utilization protein AcuB